MLLKLETKKHAPNKNFWLNVVEYVFVVGMQPDKMHANPSLFH